MADRNNRKENSNTPVKQSTSSIRNSAEWKISNMGRRRFMSYLSALGLTSIGLPKITSQQVSAAVDLDEGDIPILSRYEVRVNGDDGELRRPDAGEEVTGEHHFEPVVRGIPKQKWERILASRDAAKKIDSRVRKEFGRQVARTSVRTSNDEKRLVVKTRTTGYSVEKDGNIENVDPKPRDVSPSDLEQVLPPRATGDVSLEGEKPKNYDFSIEFESQRNRLLSHYDDRQRPVYGGSAGRSYPSRISPNYSNFTTCMPIHKNGKWMAVTAGHVFEDVDGTSRPRCYQPNRGTGGNFIGTDDTYTFEFEDDFIGYDVTYDYGLIDMEDRAEVDGALTMHGDGGHNQIANMLSWDEISAMEDSSETVYRQGRTTGQVSGNIEEITPSNHWIEVSADGDDGDSGGPFYTDTSPVVGTYDVFGIVSVSGIGDDNNFTGGNAIEFAVSEMNAEWPY